jgi:hypothetical protein
VKSQQKKSLETTLATIGFGTPVAVATESVAVVATGTATA